ncbi:hypothetical protein JYU34_017036 [Plutella xylostella]|uniref:Uncharacterized protein n=1 Tax=Plutella xylostella TaxID=51655 RepID=A0ABQ7Q432_PLUXY|nr:hypothetical protein JYU34_017036 [Plutella xylostella]
MSAMDASDGVKALDMSVRKCMLPTDTVKGSSFYSGCLAHKLMLEVVRSCRCMPYFFCKC